MVLFITYYKVREFYGCILAGFFKLTHSIYANWSYKRIIFSVKHSSNINYVFAQRKSLYPPFAVAEYTTSSVHAQLLKSMIDIQSLWKMDVEHISLQLWLYIKRMFT